MQNKIKQKKYFSPLDIISATHDQMLNVLAAAKIVKVWPETYRGTVPPPKLNERIYTEWYRNKNDAIDELKYLTAQRRCQYVQNVTYSSGSSSEGNFIYSVWSAEGII